MPAKSEKQREMMAIAEHHPEKLYKKNKSVLKMSHQQLHDFASKKKVPARMTAQKRFEAKRMRQGAKPY
jgi:hypothetical protein